MWRRHHTTLCEHVNMSTGIEEWLTFDSTGPVTTVLSDDDASDVSDDASTIENSSVGGTSLTGSPITIVRAEPVRPPVSIRTSNHQSTSSDVIEHLVLSDRDMKLVDLWTSQQRYCQLCKRNYFEINNLGEWRCAQHIGTLMYGKWTCCRLSERREGCVPCHHRSAAGTWEADDEPCKISESLKSRLGAKLSSNTWVNPRMRSASESVVYAESFVVVWRYHFHVANFVLRNQRPPTLAERNALA